jgi:microsomal dipeptidase-like Zn-dependent dipeptidase
MMKFFDLHFHPALKTLFQDQDDPYSPWDVLSPKDALLGNCLESQSSLSQISAGDRINLLCVTWHPPEMGMVDQFLLRAAAVFYKELDLARLKRIASGEDDYNETMMDERRNLNMPSNGPFTKPLKIMSSWSDYNRDDLNTLYILFNLEGGHIFYRQDNSSDNLTESYLADRLDMLRRDKVVLYLTPTHLTNNVFICHAYGNKILSEEFFIPRGYGISKLGYDLIKIAYERNILIDVKHMSVLARKQFYELHQSSYPDKPIIASHVGLTGLSWNKLSENLVRSVTTGDGFVKVYQEKPKGLVNGTHYNPNSINMYTEDLVYILKTKGLIGLSFDNRILGAKTGDKEMEFLSYSEYAELSKGFNKSKVIKLQDRKYVKNNSGTIWDTEDVLEQEDEFRALFGDKEGHEYITKEKLAIDSKTLTPENHARHFVNHILTIVSVARQSNLAIDPWKHICMGSDFDGMISAMHCCMNASETEKLKTYLLRLLPIEANRIGITLPRPVDKIVEDLFFNNAYDFLNKHLS